MKKRTIALQVSAVFLFTTLCIPQIVAQTEDANAAVSSTRAIEGTRGFLNALVEIIVLPLQPRDITCGAVVDDVLFDANVVSLNNDGRRVLHGVVEALRAMPGSAVTLTGHADDTGDSATDYERSSMRAEAAKAFLMDQGINEGRISTESRGHTEPAVPPTHEGYPRINRRVVVGFPPVKMYECPVVYNVLFDNHNHELSEQGRNVLDRLVSSMKKFPTSNVTFVGHTDDTETFDNNYELGLTRAELAKAYLIQQGIAEWRIIRKGRGQTSPTTENAIDADRR